MRWQRADPLLKARIANARLYGRGIRFEQRHANRFCYPSADALNLIERGGEIRGRDTYPASRNRDDHPWAPIPPPPAASANAG